jgi:hypothetical protein
VSSDWIFFIPEWPLDIARQKSSMFFPSAQTVPSPVMATRRISLLCLFALAIYDLLKPVHDFANGLDGAGFLVRNINVEFTLEFE